MTSVNPSPFHSLRPSRMCLLNCRISKILLGRWKNLHREQCFHTTSQVFNQWRDRATHCCYFGEATSAEYNNAALENVHMALNLLAYDRQKSKHYSSRGARTRCRWSPLTMLHSWRSLVAATRDLRNKRCLSGMRHVMICVTSPDLSPSGIWMRLSHFK